MDYNHNDAAHALHVPRGTIRNWFRTLQERGYIDTRARHPHHLEVSVSNWRPVEEWRNARQVGDGAHVNTHNRDGTSECPSECPSECHGVNTLIYISRKLESYLYPNGSHGDGPHSLADVFSAILETLKRSKNRAASLRFVFELCFGDADLPDYGYIKKVGNQVGGAGRLAEIMWQLSSKPPTGNILAYILAAHGPSKRKGKRTAQERQGELQSAVADFLEED